ncbi:MAG: YraN family protein [Pseudomonadota bacterium]
MLGYRVDKKSQKQKTYIRGLFAEYLAIVLLSLKGYRIKAHRYKTPVGEVDIIAQKKDMFVFVEVKARATKTQALESLTPKMKSRIQNAALHYCAKNKLPDPSCRFDLITVSRFCTCSHLDNAWMAAA